MAPLNSIDTDTTTLSKDQKYKDSLLLAQNSWGVSPNYVYSQLKVFYITSYSVMYFS